MDTCYMNKRRKPDYYGFNMPKGFIYGNIDGVEYITNGNPVNGRMLIYTHNGNGWTYSYQSIKKSMIAKTVNARYGDIIAEKNEKYKGSIQELADAQAWKQKSYGQELSLRTSRPYNSAAPDAKYRVRKAAQRERIMGLERNVNDSFRAYQ